jgi:hypothetical protein
MFGHDRGGKKARISVLLMHSETKMRLSKPFHALLAAAALALPTAQAQAAGDLLVAPTRVILDGSRGTEVVLNNIDDEPATYRISLELKRMTPEGGLETIDESNATAAERAALDMIRYSPRRVVLPPNQPQVVRLGVRVPDGLPAGEYRAHMLFRAVPDAVAATPASETAADRVSVSIKPIYGITIPIIVRVGDITAQAKIGNAWIEKDPETGASFNFDLARTGTRSVYGDIDVMKPGAAKPLLSIRGIAVYAELAARKVSIDIPPELAEQLKGPVTIRYTEDREVGGGTIDQVDRVAN